MKKITSLEDLRRIKEQSKDLTSARSGGKTRIIVGMGTCGIAAGAREVMTVILQELDRRGLKDVAVKSDNERVEKAKAVRTRKKDKYRQK